MRHIHSTEFTEVTCEVKRTTELAVLLHDGTRSAWVPKSQIETPDNELEVGKTMPIMMAFWIAKDKGFI